MSEHSPLLLRRHGDAPPKHFLTTPRFIVYQLTSLLSAIDSIFGTATLWEVHSKAAIATSYAASYRTSQGFLAGLLLTMAGSLAGAACGIVFLILSLHPGHYETRVTILVKEIGFTIVIGFFLAACIFATVTVATGEATLDTTALSQATREKIIAELGGSLEYRHMWKALVFVILGWVSWLSLTFSLMLVSLSGRHVLRNGPALGAKVGFIERLAAPYVIRIQKYFGMNHYQQTLEEDDD